MAQAGVYIIKNKKDQKRVYIGSSLNIQNRIRDHFTSLSKNIHHCGFLQNDFNKNLLSKDDFETEILFISNDEKEIRQVEKKFIEQYDTTHTLYNSMKVVNETYYLTEEVKGKIRKKQTGKKYSKETNSKKGRQLFGEENPMFGKKHSLESKRKTSFSTSGEKNPMFGKSIKLVWQENLSEEEVLLKEKTWKNNISESISGEKNPMFGKIRVENVDKKLIISIYNRLNEFIGKRFSNSIYESIANELNTTCDIVRAVKYRRLGKGIIQQYLKKHEGEN